MDVHVLFSAAEAVNFRQMVSTLGEALDQNWKVSAHCAAGKREAMKSVRACIKRSELDLETLVWTRGRDFPLAWLAERLRCPRCGSRLVSVIFEPPAGSRRQKAVDEGAAKEIPAWIRQRESGR